VVHSGLKSVLAFSKERRAVETSRRPTPFLHAADQLATKPKRLQSHACTANHLQLIAWWHVWRLALSEPRSCTPDQPSGQQTLHGRRQRAALKRASRRAAWAGTVSAPGGARPTPAAGGQTPREGALRGPPPRPPGPRRRGAIARGPPPVPPPVGGSRRPARGSRRPARPSLPSSPPPRPLPRS